MHEYQLRYLPQFYEDIKQHTDYIANHLQNPQAANDLIDATEEAILERQRNAEAPHLCQELYCFLRCNSRKGS